MVIFMTRCNKHRVVLSRVFMGVYKVPLWRAFDVFFHKNNNNIINSGFFSFRRYFLKFLTR
ncbi:MAG: hypothetical protein COB89_00520 [Piscirickettsiaceae bacterium]|nr:MAG: hypothetical protein COB89_00520 [Piscirickettsiaceae bacterium]